MLKLMKKYWFFTIFIILIAIVGVMKLNLLLNKKTTKTNDNTVSTVNGVNLISSNRTPEGVAKIFMQGVVEGNIDILESINKTGKSMQPMTNNKEMKETVKTVDNMDKFFSYEYIKEESVVLILYENYYALGLNVKKIGNAWYVVNLSPDYQEKYIKYLDKNKILPKEDPKKATVKIDTPENTGKTILEAIVKKDKNALKKLDKTKKNKLINLSKVKKITNNDLQHFEYEFNQKSSAVLIIQDADAYWNEALKVKKESDGWYVVDIVNLNTIEGFKE